MVASLIGIHHEMHADPAQRDLRMKVRAEAADAFEARRAIAKGGALEAVGEDANMFHAGF